MRLLSNLACLEVSVLIPVLGDSRRTNIDVVHNSKRQLCAVVPEMHSFGAVEDVLLVGPISDSNKDRTIQLV